MKFKDLPIQRKLTALVLLVSGAALLLTSFAFITYDLLAFRRDMANGMNTMANVISANSAAALAFNDDVAARQILSALNAVETLKAAALYDANGKLFARFPATAPVDALPPKPGSIGHQFEPGSLVGFYPVRKDEMRLGTLYIQSDLSPLYQRLRLYGTIVLLVICGSLVFSLVLSRWLQRSISNPILDLATLAKAVSDQRDYSVRGRKYGEDELGKLTEAFNDMLQQIHERDAALHAKQEQLSLALSASQTGTWDWDLKSNKMSWDEYIYLLFGLQPGAFPGSYERFIGVIHPQDRVAVSEAIEQTVATGKELNVEFQVVWPDATIHYLVARGKAIRDKDGKPYRMTGVCIDISERKRAEEEIRSLNAELEERVSLRTAELTATTREMEAFTYSVSHDLRAPLRHIVAFAEILQEEFGPNLDPAAQDYIRRIMQGARSMSHLVDDLLNLARISRQDVKHESVDLNKIVDEVRIDLEPELQSRNIEWQIEKLPAVECDPGLMKQVFANMLSNAVKYTRPREKAVIEVGWLRETDPVTFFIRDNGVGFNMKFIDKLFGVFQRLHRAEDFEGTGVGLATVERIIHKHGGRVWAESEVDKGTTFYFTLAAADDSEESTLLATDASYSNIAAK